MSSVTGITAKPWHLKADISLFDLDGTHPQTGTVEVWHAGDRQRAVYTFGDSSLTTLRVGSDSYHSAGTGHPVSERAVDLTDRLLHPGPSDEDLKDTNPEQRDQAFGKVHLDCIMLTRPLPHVDQIPLGLFPTYCLDKDSDRLRVIYDLGSEGLSIDGFGTFLDHQVAMKARTFYSGQSVGTATVTSLATYTPTADEFTPTPEMMKVAEAARISGGLGAGHILTKLQPQYPDSAKQRHIGGTVILRAIIDRNGRIRLLRVMSGGDADLCIAAINAVRHWVYTPYLINGEPAEVDTTVTVNFKLKPS